MSFAEATALSLTEKAGEASRFEGTIQPGWDIVGNANGGYTMSMFARAALLQSERRDVISVSAHFLSPGIAGPITIDVTPIKSGRRFATSRVELGAEKAMLAGTVITGDLDAGQGPELILDEAPEIPAPDDCPKVTSDGFFPPPFVDRIEQRLDPAFTPQAKPGPIVRGWVRLLDDEPMDTLALVLASDSLPPTVFNTDLEPNWVPTVQMTIHIRNRPRTPWLLLDSYSRFITGGMFEVDNTIFDEDGTVLAHSRQLQLLGLAHTS